MPSRNLLLVMIGCVYTIIVIAIVLPRLLPEKIQDDRDAAANGIKMTDLFADCAVTISGNPTTFTISSPRLGRIECTR